MTEIRLGLTAIGAWFYVTGSTVAKWYRENPDFPRAATATTSAQGPIYGWAPEQEQEIREWVKNHPWRYEEQRGRYGQKKSKPRSRGHASRFASNARNHA